MYEHVFGSVKPSSGKFFAGTVASVSSVKPVLMTLYVVLAKRTDAFLAVFIGRQEQWRWLFPLIFLAAVLC